ncbi:carbohydrate kinase [Thermotoga sp. KOL6]|uniref:carbohydrate kinase n=1 Tax=Thermotoga sp. KOL6 TaxID=126741 RepID=UPI000C7619EA|nr:carbohydrate kinase [Thermotoga sp. KOL6]PLV59145.1 carbohydrate kinase [Thermotoga sp. KOL6]
MITFVGHVSKDVNVVSGERKVMRGGGVVMGSIAASLLGVRSKVVTKCSKEDVPYFSFLKNFGIEVIFLDSPKTTSIENRYSNEPDKRESFLISAADPFTKDDLEYVTGEVVHVNPLWFGEFPEDLIPILRKKVNFLSADAQGFLRVPENGKLVYKKWKRVEYLRFFDLFKMDAKESAVLTGTDDLRESCKIVYSHGVKLVLVTHGNGVIVFNGMFFEAPFEGWTMEGRTGRGDTCTAAFLVAYLFKKMNLEETTKFSAKITSLKMKHPGPLKREDVEAFLKDEQC